MAILHISESEAANDFAALLQYVRDGVEVIIEDGETEIARIAPPRAPSPGEDREYDAWFAAEIQEGLDCDPATDVDGEVIRTEMIARRAEALRKLQGQQG